MATQLLTRRNPRFICEFKCTVSKKFVLFGETGLTNLAENQSAVDCLRRALSNLRDLLNAVNDTYSSSLQCVCLLRVV